MHLDYTKVIILILWWRNFQLEYWRTFQLVSTSLGAQQLISDIARVRGEFQQLEVAFQTMLGNKEQADTLMSQLVRTAAITPFNLQDVANGAKQLLAYGTEAKDVNDTLVRLGEDRKSVV